jgi:hypothetical protein
LTVRLRRQQPLRVYALEAFVAPLGRFLTLQVKTDVAA